jgi:hypothetical protein
LVRVGGKKEGGYIERGKRVREKERENGKELKTSLML